MYWGNLMADFSLARIQLHDVLDRLLAIEGSFCSLSFTENDYDTNRRGANSKFWE